LFIYPERNVAAVNELAFPVNRPVDFRITSNTVMNSFFIPRLGGQIYAMAGMETQLYLMASKPGSYFGENTQYSGRGFPYQNFVARATPPQDFEAWVKKTQRIPLGFGEVAFPDKLYRSDQPANQSSARQVRFDHGHGG
jgi:cytochrome o ubiquinol oxidase subunit II